jgi:hypothetical protein
LVRLAGIEPTTLGFGGQIPCHILTLADIRQTNKPQRNQSLRKNHS